MVSNTIRFFLLTMAQEKLSSSDYDSSDYDATHRQY